MLLFILWVKLFQIKRTSYFNDYVPKWVVLMWCMKSSLPPLVLYGLADSFLIKMFLTYTGNWLIKYWILSEADLGLLQHPRSSIIITKICILNVAAVLDPPLIIGSILNWILSCSFRTFKDLKIGLVFLR